MCGRFALAVAPEALRGFCGYDERPNFPPRYNIAPTQPVPVVTLTNGARRFTLMRWGFIPSWVKDPKDFPLIINIRSETMREKPSFRAAFQRRRALMPADGFYEWAREGRVSTPYLVERPDKAPFAFAALHETWSSADGSEVDTVALINGAATRPLSQISDRAPVILDPAVWTEWLDPATPADHAFRLLTPPPHDALRMMRIGPAVNKVANDGPEVQRPAAGDAPPPPPKPRKGSRGDDQGSLF